MRVMRMAATLAAVGAGATMLPTWAASCTQTIKPSQAYLRKVDVLVKKLKVDDKTKAEFKSRLLASADTAWVCTKSDACCTDIPLTVAQAQSSTTSCTVGVAFPYSELMIARDGGNYKPKISWKLKFDGVPPDYQFGSSGIKIDIMGGSFPPVHTQGNDKCKSGDTTDQYQCRGNGKKDAQAAHKANVYPKDHPNDPKYRCDNIDPLIVNVE